MTTLERNVLILVLLLLFIQSLWLFFNASKKGQNKWLWGFIGLLNFPSALIIYLIVTEILNKKIICPNCLYAINENSLYCSYCSHAITDEERIQGKENYKHTEEKNR